MNPNSYPSPELYEAQQMQTRYKILAQNARLCIQHLGFIPN